jgi:hypothetical protein
MVRIAFSLGIIALAGAGMAMLPALAQQSSPPAKQKPAPAKSAPAKGGMAGAWTGPVTQPGSKPYSIVMTLQASGGGETDYPDLQCGGKLTRAGAAGGYTFFLETITRGRLDKGGRCIDGSITVTMAGTQLAWGWVGIHNGQTLVAHASLKRR